MEPFFSVVTEVYNREATILRTIKSVLNQSFEDYEYIIVDAGSDDNSVVLVENFVASINDPRVIFKRYPPESNEINRWNLPLLTCRGKYVAVLEGDDWFDSKYLEYAFQKLSSDNIGIYVGRRAGVAVNDSGLLSNAQILKKFRLMQFCPPPSEAIFLRSHGYKDYKYDSEKFIWAAEYSLYNEILLDGYDVYIEHEGEHNFISRGVSYRKHSSKHLHDAFLVASKNRQFLNSREIEEVQTYLASSVGRVFAGQIMQVNFETKLFKMFIAQILDGNANDVLSAFFKAVSTKLLQIIINCLPQQIKNIYKNFR